MPWTRRWIAASLALVLALLPGMVPAVQAAEDEGGSGAGVTVTLASKILSEGRFDPGATLDLLTDPGTLMGALGGVAGFTLARRVAAAFLPPGVGTFVSILPGFLGASLGFELVQGRGGNIDPGAMVFQAVASSAGYAAFSALLGATAPGWALMLGASLFGVVANLWIRKKPERRTPDVFDRHSLDKARAEARVEHHASVSIDNADCGDLGLLRDEADGRRSVLVGLMAELGSDAPEVAAARGRYDEAYQAFVACH